MSGVLANSRFGGGGQSTELETQIVNTVSQDMDAIDKQGQWVFSCYSPAKDCVSVPGMDDICPEELRLAAYEAKAGGTIDQYINRINNLKEDYQENTISTVEVNTFGGSGQSSSISNSIFSSPQNNATPSKSIFDSFRTGAPASDSASIFGGGQSSSTTGVFGSTGASVFGGNTSAVSNPVFGGNSTIFGGTFGASTSSNTSGTAFGQTSVFSTAAQSPVKPGGLFNSSTSTIFGQSNSSNQAQTVSSSVFSTPQTDKPGIFGSSASTSAVSSPFGSTSTPAGGLFDSTPAPSGGLFGTTGSLGETGGLFGKAAEVVKDLDPSCIWSQMQQLSQEEKDAFQAESFSLGMVPIKPPPKELSV